jgi:putative FmdB family regulatory protein
MPLYEYYCQPCHAVFDAYRQMREASDPVPCPECDGEGKRIMSSFTAFTMRDGYPRKIPDKGTYWHMGKEVKKKAKRMKNWTHPELAQPKPVKRPTRGERVAAQERAVQDARTAAYRDRWGVDKMGFRTTKARKATKQRKIV